MGSFDMGQNQATETACESNQHSDLTDFKGAIISIFKEI